MQAIVHRYNRVGHFVPTSKYLDPFVKKLSIIILAYNKEKTIGFVLEKIRTVKLIQHIDKEIIVIDDCSTDKTEQSMAAYILANPAIKIKYTRRPLNKGKGTTVHCGIKHSTGKHLLIQDVDQEYNLKEYNKLLQTIADGHADVVYNYRSMGGGAHRILFFWHSIGNQFLTFLSNAFTNLHLTDMGTAYKVFRTNALQQIHLVEAHFGLEPEGTAKIARVPRIRLYELGVSYYGKTYKESKKIKWWDKVRTVFCVLKYFIFGESRADVSQQKPVHIPKAASQVIH